MTVTWYNKKRMMVDDAFKLGKPKDNLTKIEKSPLGRYNLQITPYEISANGWDYCLASVYDTDSRTKIADLKRNYGNFPCCWIESHKETKKDYLIFSEDYQGMSVLDLKTGQIINEITDSMKEGNGFCPSSFDINEDGTRLCVTGCVWAAPYEIVIYDFKDPMKYPFKEKCRIDAFTHLNGVFEDLSVVGWNKNKLSLIGTCEYYKGNPVDSIFMNETDNDKASELLNEMYSSNEVKIKSNLYELNMNGVLVLKETFWD